MACILCHYADKRCNICKKFYEKILKTPRATKSNEKKRGVK